VKGRPLISKSGADPFQIASLRGRLDDLLLGFRSFALDKGVEVHAALLDIKGDLINVAGPNPLHYPAFEACVKAAKKYIQLKHGETIITNDPYSGNTRLCDLMLIQGAYGKSQANELRYYVAVQITFEGLLNKDLSKIFTSVEDEGYRIPPSLLDDGSRINSEIVKYLCQKGMNADQITSALEVGRETLRKVGHGLIALEQSLGREKISKNLEELKKYSEAMMRRALHEIPDGEYSAHDVLENDGVDKLPVRIQCQLTVHGENILLSFSGSTKQVKGPFNCNHTQTLGACFWFLRSLVKADIPINAGAFKAFSIEAPDGTVVNAKYPAPLLGGYYETSKRIVDTLCLVLNKALPSHFPAQNGGSSNIALFLFESSAGTKFLVDTLGCGTGASKYFNGRDCVHGELHNTPARSVEALETEFPLQVTHSGIRESSGGDGKLNGGNGLTRGYRFLEPIRVMMLSDRKNTKARGLYGGVSGLNGESMLVRHADKKKIQNEKWLSDVDKGDTLIINTPGGGGWGKKEEPEKE